jgi:hypothetical protein
MVKAATLDGHDSPNHFLPPTFFSPTKRDGLEANANAIVSGDSIADVFVSDCWSLTPPLCREQKPEAIASRAAEGREHERLVGGRR